MANFRTSIAGFNRLDYFCLVALVSIGLPRGGAELLFGISLLKSQS
jgi:hypothetical protein